MDGKEEHYATRVARFQRSSLLCYEPQMRYLLPVHEFDSLSLYPYVFVGYIQFARVACSPKAARRFWSGCSSSLGEHASGLAALLSRCPDR
jgi:hypothetical protein